MNKPSWADRVVEVTSEEARALVAMGHKVYWDYSGGPLEEDWCKLPMWCAVLDCTDFQKRIPFLGDEAYNNFFYMESE